MPTALNGSETHERRQIPFRVQPGTAYGSDTVDLVYESYTTLPNGRTLRQPMLLHAGDLSTAVLELIRLYNDVLAENTQREKNHEHDQRTISRLEGEIEKMKHQLRGHETKPKAKV